MLVDGEPTDPALIYDRYGGYWIVLLYDPEENTQVLLRVSIERE